MTSPRTVPLYRPCKAAATTNTTTTSCAGGEHTPRPFEIVEPDTALPLCLPRYISLCIPICVGMCLYICLYIEQIYIYIWRVHAPEIVETLSGCSRLEARRCTDCSHRRSSLFSLFLSPSHSLSLSLSLSLALSFVRPAKHRIYERARASLR